MPAKATRPQAHLVRSYLRALPDRPGQSPAKVSTLQSVAREHELPIGKLRQFRDGRDSALSKSVVTTWAKLLGSDDDIALGGDDPLNREWYRTLMCLDNTREANYRVYETIEETRPEAARALDCWADIVCTGSVGEDRYGGGFEPNYNGDKAWERKLLNVIAEEINTHILPPAELLMLVRDVAKNGDDFEQVGITRELGQPRISRLVNMPTRTMHYHKQEDASIDPEQAFKQIPPGKIEPSAYFPQWKIVHFANKYSRADLYGRSVFWSARRSWIQIEALEAGMMIRRLERAPFRLKHTLDVSHCSSQKEIESAIDAHRLRHKKAKTIDGNRNFHNQKISMPADEDLFLAKRTPDSPADIEGLQGDAKLADIDDFLHFFNKWLGGLGPPKSHLGYEADTVRSVGTELHVVFARMGRRLQMKIIHGLVHLYWLSLILRNIDPRTVPFTIYPPAVGTRDELLRAQVQLAHATTVRYLGQTFGMTGKMPSEKWFLQYIMGLDDEVIDKLELVDVLQQPRGGSVTGRDGPKPKESREMAAGAFLSGDVQDEIFKTQFFLNERAIGLRKPELLRGGAIEQYQWLRPHDPFGPHFDAVVQSLGMRPSQLRRLNS